MRIARYFVVGGASAGVDFALFGVLLAMLGKAHWFAAGASSFMVATLFNYFASIAFVFSAGVRFGRRLEVLLIFGVSLIGLGVNQAALWIFYDVVGWNIWIAKCAGTASAFLWNFAARNSFIFRGSA